MNKGKLFERLCFYGLVFLAFNGAMFIDTVLHEYSHFRDARGLIIPNSDRICIYEIPVNSTIFDIFHAKGRYEWSYLPNVTQEQKDRINGTTEWKAYPSGFILTLLPFCLFFMVVLWYRVKNAESKDLNSSNNNNMYREEY